MLTLFLFRVCRCNVYCVWCARVCTNILKHSWLPASPSIDPVCSPFYLSTVLLLTYSQMGPAFQTKRVALYTSFRYASRGQEPELSIACIPSCCADSGFLTCACSQACCCSHMLTSAHGPVPVWRLQQFISSHTWVQFSTTLTSALSWNSISNQQHLSSFPPWLAFQCLGYLQSFRWHCTFALLVLFFYIFHFQMCTEIEWQHLSTWFPLAENSLVVLHYHWQ